MRVDGVGGDSRLAHALEEGVHFGCFAGPVGLDSGDSRAVHFAEEFGTGEYGGFVRLAGEAPVGGDVDEHGASGLGEVRDEFFAVAVPAAFEHLLACAGFKTFRDDGFVLRAKQGEPECRKNDCRNGECADFAGKGRSRRGYFPDGETAGDGDGGDGREQQYARRAGLLVYDPQEPCDGCQKQDAHDFLERDHPGARFREDVQNGRECAHEQVGGGKADARRGKEQEQYGRRRGEREAHGGAEQWR